MGADHLTSRRAVRVIPVYTYGVLKIIWNIFSYHMRALRDSKVPPNYVTGIPVGVSCICFAYRSDGVIAYNNIGISRLSAAFPFNPYWLGNNWEYNSKYVRLTETNPFSCQHCGKRYRWKSTLKRHESFECGGKEPAHKCPHCDYRAKQSGNLRVHIRKYHTDRTSVGSAAVPVVNDLLPAASSGK